MGTTLTHGGVRDRFRDGVTLHTSRGTRAAPRSVPWAATLPLGPQQSRLLSAGGGVVSGASPQTGGWTPDLLPPSQTPAWPAAVQSPSPGLCPDLQNGQSGLCLWFPELSHETLSQLNVQNSNAQSEEGVIVNSGATSSMAGGSTSPVPSQLSEFGQVPAFQACTFRPSLHHLEGPL